MNKHRPQPPKARYASLTSTRSPPAGDLGDLPSYFEKTLSDFTFTYQPRLSGACTSPCVAVYLRERKPPVDRKMDCFVLEANDLLAYLLAGGTAALWKHPAFGPCSKYRINGVERTVSLARWLLDCKKGQNVVFGLEGRYDLTRANIHKTWDKRVTTAPARDILAESYASRGLAQGRTLADRLVDPKSLVDKSKPFLAWV